MKWLPGQPVNNDTLATALFLENDYWEKQRIAINNGFVSAQPQN